MFGKIEDLTRRLDIEKIEWEEEKTGLFHQILILNTSIDVIWYVVKNEKYKGPGGIELIRPDKDNDDGGYEMAWVENGEMVVKSFGNDVNSVINKIKELKQNPNVEKERLSSENILEKNRKI